MITTIFLIKQHLFLNKNAPKPTRELNALIAFDAIV